MTGADDDELGGALTGVLRRYLIDHLSAGEPDREPLALMLDEAALLVADSPDAVLSRAATRDALVAALVDADETVRDL